VQFLIDKKTAGATSRRLDRAQARCAPRKPPASQLRMSFSSCLRGTAISVTRQGRCRRRRRRNLFAARLVGTAFNNTSSEDVVLGVGLDGRRFHRSFGYEVHPRATNEALGRSTYQAGMTAQTGAAPNAHLCGRKALAGKSGLVRRRRWRSCASRRIVRLSDAGALLADSALRPA